MFNVKWLVVAVYTYRQTRLGVNRVDTLVPMDSQKDTDLIADFQCQLVEWLQTHCRRNGGDRRAWQPMPALPFKDGHGNWVTEDRRVLPERRLKSIQVTWLYQQ